MSLQSHKVHGLAGWFDAYFEVSWFVGLLGWFDYLEM